MLRPYSVPAGVGRQHALPDRPSTVANEHDGVLVLGLRSRSNTHSKRIGTKSSSKSVFDSVKGTKLEEQVAKVLAEADQENNFEHASRQIGKMQDLLYHEQLTHFHNPKTAKWRRGVEDPKRKSGMYDKCKDLRKAKDNLSKALKADIIDQIKLESSWSEPTVRTILRISDEIDVQAQVAKSDDPGGLPFAGTASLNFVDSILKLDMLRGHVADAAEERERLKDDKFRAMMTHTIYGRNKVVVQASKDVEKKWSDEELASMEQPLAVSVGKLDNWMDRHLRSR